MTNKDYPKHPYLLKGFWKENRFWNNGWHSQKTKDKWNKWADKIVSEKLKPENK